MIDSVGGAVKTAADWSQGGGGAPESAAEWARLLEGVSGGSKPLVGGDPSDLTDRVAEAHARIRQTLRVAGLLRELQTSFEDRQKALINRLSVLEEEVGETVLLTMRLTKRKEAVLARQEALESKMADVIDLLRRRQEDCQLKDLQRNELWQANCRLIDLTRGQLTQQRKHDSAADHDLEIAKCSTLVNEKEYYDESKFTDLASEKKFEKDLMSKTARLNNRNDVEVALVDEYIVLVRQSNDVMLAVLARESENDIMMLDFTTSLYQVLCNITHNNVCRKKIIDKLDLVFLMIDEAVEKGVILETDSAVITSRIKMQNEETSTTASDDRPHSTTGTSRTLQGFASSSQEASFKSALSSVRDQIGNFLSR
ncbi:Coatomer subunit zeta-1 [Perkinsus olseni]|uniref:Coatomer subunit zeta n=1 Tax=Perkinsus olseni TaxID=32597 RepID=A0A7J6U6I8_PEROL|nr:Coatomer subunit zeta-1 [Perkinsus olseni]